MIFRVYFDTNNAAFEPSNGAEIARILRDIADKIETHDVRPDDCGPIRDANGNRVGSWIATGSEG